MTEREDELDASSRAVLDDLFTSALSTPDPGSKVDLASILAAARAENAPAEPVRPVPVDHDAVQRRSGRARLWQTLGGLVAAAALTFGVVQLLPSQSGDSAAMSQAPARAADAPASTEAGEAEALPAPMAVPDEESAEDGGSAARPEQSEAASASAESGAVCVLPPAAVLDAAVAAAPDWAVTELPGDVDCLGFRLIGSRGEFDVVLRPATQSDTSSLSALSRDSGTYLVQAVPIPGAATDSVDPTVARAVVEAVAAVAG